ncbi:MAG: RNA methyltransferase [Muribaculaceae bacterium]|nr:RNA methyltransferase [Muribaculaceae bacterium]
MKKKSMTDLHRVSADSYAAVEKIPLVVVLDDVRSEMNVGSILRTADAFVVQRVVMCGITSTPPRPEIHKTALGAEDTVAWEYCPTALEAVERLRSEDYTICAIEQVHGSVSMEAFDVETGKKYAVVLGNEVKGVAQEVVDACDCCVEIPQRGTKHSLNVANTAALVMWHFFSHSLEETE